MTKLSKKSRALLEFVRDYSRSRPSVRDFPGAYTETGRYKPWHNKTVKALADRGLVLVVESEPFAREWGAKFVEAKLTGYLADSKVFFLTLTEAGKKLFEKEEDK